MERMTSGREYTFASWDATKASSILAEANEEGFLESGACRPAFSRMHGF